MLATGLLLVLFGFALVVPRGAVSGSMAVRNVPMGVSHIHRTPGYQDAPTGRVRWLRLGTGLAMFAGGFLLIVLAS